MESDPAAAEAVAKLRDYLSLICPSLLAPGDGTAAATFTDALADGSVDMILTKFACSSSTSVVYVTSSGTANDISASSANGEHAVAVCGGFTFADGVPHVELGGRASIAVIKGVAGALEPERSMAAQLQVMTVPGARDASASAHDLAQGSDKIFSILQLYAKHSFAPLVQGYASATASAVSASASGGGGGGSGSGNSGTAGETDKGVMLLQRRLRELELALVQCQKRREIPALQLTLHPDIAAAVTGLPEDGKVDIDQLGLSFRVTDDGFLNSVQAIVNQWVKDIQRTVRLANSTPFPGTAAEEMDFWASLAAALASAEAELRSPGVRVTVELLKRAKRFLATIALDTGTGLHDAIISVSDINSFIKPMPLAPLLGAADLAALSAAIPPLFNHFGRLKNCRDYDMERAALLVESLSRALAERLPPLLCGGGRALLHAPYQDAAAACAGAAAAFQAWDDGYSSFQPLFVTLCRKRTRVGGSRLDGAELLRSLTLPHLLLKERIAAVARFREQHDRLAATASAALASADPSALPAVEAAYSAAVAGLDCLDTSEDGQRLWETALDTYERGVDKVDERVTELLRRRLGAAKTADEMFGIFNQFNPLFTRERIASAVAGFQQPLLVHVREAVQLLQEKFTRRYEPSSAHALAGLRDLPPLAGKILWARHIERQLSLMVSRVEAVLGPGWEQHAEGRRLRNVCDELLRNLDTQRLLLQWIEEWKGDLVRRAGAARLQEHLLVVGRDRAGSLRPEVNFDEKTVGLFKEVRNLQWLGVQVPDREQKIMAKIQELANTASQRYPAAMALRATLRTYQQTRAGLTVEASELLVPNLRAIRNQVAEAFEVNKRSVHWDSPQLSDWVAALSEHVFVLQEKSEEVCGKFLEVQTLLERLSRCPYDPTSMGLVLAELQAVVDAMSLAGFSNVQLWVKELDRKVETVLLGRLGKALAAWVAAFGSPSPAPAAEDDMKAAGRAAVGEEGGVQVDCIVHEILLRNQVLYVSPPLEFARASWLHQLHRHMDVAAGLPRLRSGRFAVFHKEGGLDNAVPAAYGEILKGLPREVLETAYAQVEGGVAEASSYVSTWLQYQSLWDISTAAVHAKLGEDTGRWVELLRQAKQARSGIEGGDAETTFGPIIIDYSKVQSKINIKYDAWQKELQSAFSRLLAEAMHNSRAYMVSEKMKLENAALDGATKDVVSAVTVVQEAKSAAPKMRAVVAELIAGERTLRQQRHQFAPDWPQSSLVSGALMDFEQILGRRVSTMEAHLPALRRRVAAEAESVGTRAESIAAEWEEKRPLRGDVLPSEALAVISVTDEALQSVAESLERLAAAQAALGLPVSTKDPLAVAKEEITGLREVWAAMDAIWESLQELRDTAWAAVVLRRVRSALDAASEQLRQLPNRVRQYEACANMQARLCGYLAAQPLLNELRSEALKERHWKPLLKCLGMLVSVTQLTLGHLWAVDLEAHKRDIHETVATAQGEMALEEFLRQVREAWQAMSLDLVPYQGRVRLIRGWDTIFAKLEEHLSSLTSMKQSPYFRNVQEFKETAALWEDRLTKLQAIMDAWVDVQRKWVYLAGIFYGSADIKAQLPAEFGRFKGVDSQFVQLMRRVAQTPAVLKVLAIENVSLQLERQNALMTGVQKALGEYLERQRGAFSRFYFVGDEDLLDIVGNADEPAKVAPHLGKMFASIGSVAWTVDSAATAAATAAGQPRTALSAAIAVTAILSKDGEDVELKTPVAAGGIGVQAWLAALEREMHTTLADALAAAVVTAPGLASPKSNGSSRAADLQSFLAWCAKFPAQVVLLASQVQWSAAVNAALSGSGGPAGPAAATAVAVAIDARIALVSENLLGAGAAPRSRRTFEQLVTELVHERDVTRGVAAAGASNPLDFHWLRHLRFSFEPKTPDPLARLHIAMADATFHYGFEYLGLGDRLVQTPLTDRCFLTLTQALRLRMGGNPFGPAGTGKTESVKALGAQLGRFVLVFNCDDSFDYGAMGRLFVGLCQVGAWGCFDEFNRLEERILSAVSQQILAIQHGLSQRQKSIELLGRTVRLSPHMGIFVTMNPGYAGRSNLPDNLKQLFRAVAMVQPDYRQIAQVMLFSQGITTAEALAGRIVLLFRLCEEQLSQQQHYDFGLRALKSVLTGAGALKRASLAELATANVMFDIGQADMAPVERDVLIRSACNAVVPKLVANDLPLFTALLAGVFPGCGVTSLAEERLRTLVKAACGRRGLHPGAEWIEKVLQLRLVLELRHGVMIVGPSGTGKTSAWRILLEALDAAATEDIQAGSSSTLLSGADAAAAAATGLRSEAYVIDPKALTKESLYGSLDTTTLEWTDGVFTRILRDILANKRGGGAARRHWIVFDGDVDPDWAENLNSVLDDNRVLTLPSGERLELPQSVRILLEVDSLTHATPATVSRCGMVWFSGGSASSSSAEAVGAAQSAASSLISGGEGAGGCVTTDMLLRHRLHCLRESNTAFKGDEAALVAHNEFVDALEPYLLPPADPVAAAAAAAAGDEPVVVAALRFAMSRRHVMLPTRERLVESLFALLARGAALVADHNEGQPDFSMPVEELRRFAERWLLQSAVWGLGGSMAEHDRIALSETLVTAAASAAPPAGSNLTEMRVRVSDGGWEPWSVSVPKTDIESHRVVASDVVVTTTDTVRHVEVLRAWLASHKPLVLCGPPGSGKTMTLTSTLQSMPELVLVTLNFSSSTTPALVHKTFKQYCEYARTPAGVFLEPSQSLGVDKWLVIFCDEINLPAPDAYGTQHVIAFLRQLTEHGGFWREDRTWVSLRRIQFVGACNPPEDTGRVRLPPRFLRHAPLLLVDFPARESLQQIYGSFVGGLLRLQPALRGQQSALTGAMLDVYERNKERFRADMRPQYVYSPRELSRWVRALYEAMSPLDGLSLESLVRLWAHEGIRLFHDRLVAEDERIWCRTIISTVGAERFPNASVKALEGPLLYSCWLSKNYLPVDRDTLRDFVAARLRAFYEEELDVPLVVFDDVLDHVLRIDRVLRQPMGHLLLAGESGVGKTVLARFVAWMNGLSIFTVEASPRYTLGHFDDDLRSTMRRVGCAGESLCFLVDESDALGAAFMERMNALLSSGEVPGLFDGEDRAALLAGCREAAQRDGVAVDSEQDLLKRFTTAVQRGLHVVFSMNPAVSDFDARCSASPALFNRCVVDWLGTWSATAMAQVGLEFTSTVDTGDAELSSGLPENEDSEGKEGGQLEHSTYVPTATDEARTAALLAVLDGALADAGAEVADGAAEAPGESSGIRLAPLRKAVVAALVGMHRAAQAAAEKVARGGGRRQYTSPRDYLDLIRQFVNLMAEKRSNLEEQQLHMNIGLQRVRETAVSVAELSHGLDRTGVELRKRDEEANAKLQQMVGGQNEAERRRTAATALQAELEKQNAEMASRRGEAEKELAEAEPALIEAQQSVQQIKKPQLDEVRALARPPKAVQVVLEAVVTLLGHSNPAWADVRKVIAKADFIATVVGFKSESLSDRLIADVEAIFTTAGDLDVDSVNRASKACGPLFQWVKSQLAFSRIAMRVQPLRDEVNRLQAESNKLTAGKQKLDSEVAELETSITMYKKEYADAIRGIEAIKAEMAAVRQKVSRAEALIGSLAQEKDRWEGASAGFRRQMRTLLGDCLLAAAFLTYAGAFDFRARRALLAEWSSLVALLGVPAREGLSCADYLSRPADRLRWQCNGLPTDDLCVENAVILSRFNRFPLVVDPSGQAVQFLLAEYAERKIATTSFADTGFLKKLAGAVRFGTPLLVLDVEGAGDPAIHPILNRELRRANGRTLVRLAGEDVDFSPQTLVVLATRDPDASFAPDLCSRVTLVNFTVTPASLRNQALAMALRAERPDVEQRRSALLQQQGEQSVRLRQLEDTLLDTIGAAQGAILDDDTVVQALEGLKAEASGLAAETAATKEVAVAVAAESALYEPLADACAAAYFAVDALRHLNQLYHFSLSFFLECLAGVLAPGRVPATPSGPARLHGLTGALFADVARRVTRALLQDDRLAFAARLAQVYLRSRESATAPTDAELDLLLRGATSAPSVAGSLTGATQRFSERQARELTALCRLPSGAGLEKSITTDSSLDWEAFLASPSAETCVPGDWLDTKLDRHRAAFLRLLVVRALRPDRVMRAMELFVTATFGPDFPWNEPLDLEAVVGAAAGIDGRTPAAAARPIIICSDAGHDASWRVDTLAERHKVPLAAVAMGSSEGYQLAERGVTTAARDGSWVLLRNVHLCPDWLESLEKRLHALRSPQRGFRVFLTSDISPRLPASLLRQSDIVVAEAAPGVRANILRFLRGVPAERMAAPPAERCRLYVLAAWLHAVVLERLRYTPVGWSKKHEFSEADAACALAAVDNWLDTVPGAGSGESNSQPALGLPAAAKGAPRATTRAHVAPEDIQWPAMCEILSQSVYGGRIDDTFDQKLLESFVERLFSPASFDVGFPLSEEPAKHANETATPLVIMPDVATRQAFLDWAEALPHNNPPTWLGLAPQAEILLQETQGSRTLGHWLALQDDTVESELPRPSTSLPRGLYHGFGEDTIPQQVTAPHDGGAVPPPRAQAILEASRQWLALLPSDLQVALLSRTACGTFESGVRSTDEAGALERCVQREAVLAAEVICRVRSDLLAVIARWGSNKDTTLGDRSVASALLRGFVPQHWSALASFSHGGVAGVASAGAAAATLGDWIEDLRRRAEQLTELVRGTGPLEEQEFWLGGFFSPEAFVTATRQHAATGLGCSLDDLSLTFDIGKPLEATTESVAFAVTNLALEGAGYDAASGQLSLGDELRSLLPVCFLRWQKNVAVELVPAATTVLLPLYLRENRTQLVAEVALQYPKHAPLYVWQQRGVALIAWQPAVGR